MTKKTLSTNILMMKRILSLTSMVLGLLFIFGAAIFWGFNQRVQQPSSAPLPDTVAGLALTESSLGEKAIAEFTRLHGENFPLTSGAVGMYGSDHSATLWVAGASSRPLAGRLLAAMRDKIAGSTGESPFIPVGELQDGSRTVYELDGLGQKHFSFQSGKLLIWLAVEPQRAEEALSTVLKFYP